MLWKNKFYIIIISIIIILTALHGCSFLGAPKDEVLDKKNKFIFEYNCEEHEIELDLAENYNNYFYDKRPFNKLSEEEYYKFFLKSKDDKRLLSDLINSIKDKIKTNNTDEIAIAVVSLVQYIEYDCNKYNSDKLKSSGHKTNYPYETLYTEKSVCRDSSVLLAKILNNLGYGTAFFLYDKENHMSVGISCPKNYSLDNTGYCYIETTSPSRIGIQPKSLNLTKQKVEKISDGMPFSKIIELKKEYDNLENLYGEKILSISRCKEVEYYKTITNLKSDILQYSKLEKLKKESIDLFYNNTIAKHEKELENLNKILISKKNEIIDEGQIYSKKQSSYDRERCNKITTNTQYKICLDIYESIEETRSYYNSLINEYSDIVLKYNTYYDKYSIDFEIYKRKNAEYTEIINSHNNASNNHNRIVELYNEETKKHFTDCIIEKDFNPSEINIIQSEEITMIKNNVSEISS